MLALSASSCRDRSEPISPEPFSRSNSTEQTIYVDSTTLDWKSVAQYRAHEELAKGQVIGIRIFIDGGDAGSEPDHDLGLHTLDRIEAVDGVPARTTQAVVEAFARIRKMQEVRFHVRRRGHLLRLVYRPARGHRSRG
jgi:hypothetical protein